MSFSYKFYLRNSGIQTQGRLYLRVIYRRRVIEKSLGVSLETSLFDAEKGVAKGNSLDSVRANALMMQYQERLKPEFEIRKYLKKC
jgi:hypothetical protein